MEENTQITTENTTLPQEIKNKNIQNESTKWTPASWARSLLYMTLASLLLSFAGYCLIKPNGFTIGGITGISILINVGSHDKIPQSLSSFCLNFPLLLLAFFYLKKRFAILSAINIGMQSLWLLMFEELLSDFQIAFTNSDAEKIFAAIAAGLCVGTAVVLSLKGGGSTGGIDILGIIIQRKVGANSIAWILFCFNVTVISSSLFVFYNPEQALAYNLLPIMLSAFESYIDSKTIDSLTNGFQSACEFRIITDKPEEMAQALMDELSRGVTAIPATGMYTKFTHTMILCVVSRRQVATLKRVMKRIDPDSFAVMSNVSQVLGLGFYTQEL